MGFIWFHNVIWSVGIPIIALMLWTSLIIMSTALEVSTVPLLSAFDSLDAEIASSGLRLESTDKGAYTVCQGAVLRPDFRDLQKFQQKWTEGMQGYIGVQRQLAFIPMQWAFLAVFSVVGYIAHVSTFTDFGFNAATFQFCNFTAFSALFVPLSLAPALGVTLHLRKLFAVQHRLVFDSPHSKLFVSGICGSKGDLDCHALSPRMIV